MPKWDNYWVREEKCWKWKCRSLVRVGVCGQTLGLQLLLMTVLLWDKCLALVGLVLPAGVQHLFEEWGGCKSPWDLTTVCSWAVLGMGLSSLPTEQTPELWAGVQRSVPVLS